MEVARFHISNIAMILLYFANQKGRRKNPTTGDPYYMGNVAAIFLHFIKVEGAKYPVLHE